jgi:hypothetical protein
MRPPAGANVVGLSRQFSTYQGHITSYDYDCPVGEAGSTGHLGIGGGDKYAALRQVILEATGRAAVAASRRRLAAKAAAAPAPPAVPAEPRLAAYGLVSLAEGAEVMANLGALVSGDKASEGRWPRPMEQYGQAFGLALYSTRLDCGPGGLWGQRGVQWRQQGQQQGQQGLGLQQYLDFAAHDWAKILLGDEVVRASAGGSLQAARLQRVQRSAAQQGEARCSEVQRRRPGPGGTGVRAPC